MEANEGPSETASEAFVRDAPLSSSGVQVGDTAVFDVAEYNSSPVAEELYNIKTAKGKTFLLDRKSAGTNLPTLLPKGLPYAANFVSFDALKRSGALQGSCRQKVSVTAEELRLLFEAKCLDQDLPPNWEREMRFMELVSCKCQGTFFCLPESGFRVHGAEVISSILSANRSYSILDLSGNHLGDAGAQHIASLLRMTRSLAHVNLASNDIGPAGGVAIAEALQSNNTVVSLNLGGRAGLTGNHIGLKGAEAVGKLLSCNEVLTKLDLASNGLGAVGLTSIVAGIGSNRCLTHLDLASNNLGAEGVRALSTILEDSCITHLSLERNHIGDAGGAALFKSIAEAVAAGADTLQYVNVEFNDFGARTAQSVGKALTTWTSLVSLKLGKNTFGAAARHIFTGAGESKTLQALHLPACGIPESAGASIRHMLLSNPSLARLDVSGNRLKDEGTADISSGIASSRSIVSVDLSSNKVGDAGGYALAKALVKNATLRQLNLRRNIMGSACGDALLDSFASNTTVESMDVAYNDFSFKCTLGITKMLSRNAEMNQRRLMPALREEIETLAPKEKDLERTEEEVEMEKRVIKDRSEQLLRRDEEARVVSEKLKRQVVELERTFEQVSRCTEEAENAFHIVEDRVTTATEELRVKKVNMETRIQQEKDRVDRLRRQMEKMQKEMHAIEEKERALHAPLITDMETTKVDSEREMADAKFEGEKLAQLELRKTELSIALSGKGKKKKG